jgi:hypothetical protein
MPTDHQLRQRANALEADCRRRWQMESDPVIKIMIELGMSDAVMEQVFLWERKMLPTDAKERKEIPLATGVLDYFPAALAEVAKVSFAGNQQHNPGEPLHWARSKSTDQDDTLIRHFLDRGGLDSDGQRHSAKLAWRALALLQLELEVNGAPIARGARQPSSVGEVVEEAAGTKYYDGYCVTGHRETVSAQPTPILGLSAFRGYYGTQWCGHEHTTERHALDCAENLKYRFIPPESKQP